MTSSPKGRLAEAIATVDEFLAHATALGGMGIELSLPPELVKLARRILLMVDDTSTSAHSTSTKKGMSSPNPATGSRAFLQPAAPESPRADLVWQDPPPRRRTVREAVLTVIKEDEVVSVPQVDKRLQQFGFLPNPNTTSNELSRWANLGVLEKVRRGQYRRGPRLEGNDQSSAAPHASSAQKALADTNKERADAYGEHPAEGAKA